MTKIKIYPTRALDREPAKPDPDITPEAIDRQIKAFLAKGGEVQQIPDGKETYVLDLRGKKEVQK